MAPDIQKIDVWFEPDAAKAQARTQLGLLGGMCGTPCLLEPFRKTPSFDELLDCMNKQLSWYRVLRLRAKRQRNQSEGKAVPKPGLPRLWILSPGVPRQAMEKLALAPSKTFGVGVYEETLELRLLARGSTQKKAIEELAGLPGSEPRRAVLIEIITGLRFLLPPNAICARRCGRRTKRASGMCPAGSRLSASNP